jgi:hypothetical protein
MMKHSSAHNGFGESSSRILSTLETAPLAECFEVPEIIRAELGRPTLIESLVEPPRSELLHPRTYLSFHGAEKTGSSQQMERYCRGLYWPHDPSGI